jgi:hypothetical protein
MDSKSLHCLKSSTFIGAGLGGWFGMIYGGHLANVDSSRGANPFERALYVSQKAGRYGAISAVLTGALACVYKSYEYRAKDLK